MLGEPLPILYVSMLQWKYFFSTKWERREEIKRELFTQGEVPVWVRAFSWGRVTWGREPEGVPKPQENAQVFDDAMCDCLVLLMDSM